MPSDLLERIEASINKIRPYIQQDGGDLQLVDYKDGVVTVRMVGACAGCVMASQDISDGVQAILIDEIPEVKQVIMEAQETNGLDGTAYDNNGGNYSYY
ncbi:MAG: NifU family protein [Solobacterium sp.]|nr:NifU family protein [Solobacterium sp.]MCH4222009.1 NifU family protein [Solobacterium sp.]MCH4266046.1 NifU family protein [Solobacterium sp.]